MKMKFLKRLIAICIVLCMVVEIPSGMPWAHAASELKNESLQEEISSSAFEELGRLGTVISDLPDNVRRMPGQDLKESAGSKSRAVFSSSYDDTQDSLNALRIEDEGKSRLYIFSDPVKYMNKKGELCWIDTSMEPVTGNGKYSYQNAGNSFRVSFGKNAAVGINLDGICNVRPVNEESGQSIVTLKSKTNAGNGRVVYPNAFGKGTTLEYINTATGIKENIVLDAKTERNTYSFLFESKTHVPVLAEDKKTIEITSISNGASAYHISPLLVYDSFVGECDDFEHITNDAWYEVSEVGSGRFIISIFVSAEWLSSAEIVWPVTIDPSYIADYTSSNVSSTYVDENYPSQHYSADNTTIKFGHANNKTISSYIKFNTLPTPSSSDNATSMCFTGAGLSLMLMSSYTSGTVYCSQVTSSWNKNTVKWSDKPTYTSDYRASAQVAETGEGPSVYFDVSIIVAKWLRNPSSNYGFQIDKDGLSSWLYTSYYADDLKKPYLWLDYATCGNSSALNNKVFYIKNNYSGKYMTASQTGIVQQTFTGTAAQQWKITYSGSDGWFYIAPQSQPTQRLAFYSANPANGTSAYSLTYNQNSSAQKFRFVRYNTTTNQYLILLKGGVLRGLDVRGPSTADNAVIQAWDYVRASQQQWTLQEVSAIVLTQGVTRTDTLAPGGLKWYKFTPSTTGIYRIYTTGSLNTRGELWSPGKVYLYEENNNEDVEGSKLNFGITNVLDAGKTYWIRVNLVSTASSGTYSIRAEKLRDTAFGRGQIEVNGRGIGLTKTVVTNVCEDGCKLITDYYSNGEVYITFYGPDGIASEDHSNMKYSTYNAKNIKSEIEEIYAGNRGTTLYVSSTKIKNNEDELDNYTTGSYEYYYVWLSATYLDAYVSGMTQFICGSLAQSFTVIAFESLNEYYKIQNQSVYVAQNYTRQDAGVTKTVVSSKSGAVANASSGYSQPPYDSNGTVYDVKTNAVSASDKKLVRVYTTAGNPNGSWVTTADDIRGLTPAQIQDKLALQSTPVYYTYVGVAGNSDVEVSCAGTNSFGVGGGLQFRSINGTKWSFEGEYKLPLN